MNHQATQGNTKIVFALKVSTERAELQTKLNNLMNKMEKTKGLDVQWKNCSYKSHTVKFAVDWRTEELACPRGMQASSDVVNCGKVIVFLLLLC